MARAMVCEWGMSDAMGPLTFGKKEEQIFLGREIAQRSDYSEDTALRIDQEVKRIVTENYQRALTILQEYKEHVQKLADALLAREVLDGDQVKRIVAGLSIDETARWSAGATARRERRPHAQGIASRVRAQPAQSAAAAVVNVRVPGAKWRPSSSRLTLDTRQLTLGPHTWHFARGTQHLALSTQHFT